jgi:hypothetical protein
MARTDPASKQVIRRHWDGRAFRVATVDPQHGDRVRGRIYPVSSIGGWQCTWRVIDDSGNEIALLRGDYLDAEAALLDATATPD